MLKFHTFACYETEIQHLRTSFVSGNIITHVVFCGLGGATSC